ncbi:MAG: S8 family peptidase [Candidatus Puniceispirillales bacterium]
MNRFKAYSRHSAGAASVFLVGLTLVCTPPQSAAAENDIYSFSRWQITTPEVTSGPATATPAMTLPAGGFPVAAPSPSMLPNLDTIIPDQTAAGLMDTGAVPEGLATGFFSGIDMGTVMIYSSGAVLGVIGSNMGRDGKDDTTSAGTSFLTDPADYVTEEFETQYGLAAVNAQYAYARGHTGEGVLVSVMDTPFNTSHANLTDVFVDGYHVVTEDTVVDVGCTGGTNPCRHGTHVAGIIAGNKTDVDSSMHGVAYGAQIKPIPFLNSGITTGAQQVSAFEHASGVDNGTGLQIVAMNNSWGAVPGFHTSQYNGKYFKIPNQTSISVSDSVYLGSTAAADADTILVFAAGNDGWNAETGVINLYDSEDADVASGTALATEIAADAGANISSANMIDTSTAMPTYAPDNSSYVIDEAENEHMWLVVVATDSDNTIATFSNACGVAKNYCLAAPGEAIVATNGANSPAYVTLNGTSMAAPHVTGAIAILADMYPNLLERPENISQILLETATDLGDTGVDDIYGHGLLNLQDATGPLGDITITDSGFGSSSLTYGGDAEISSPVAFGDALTRHDIEIGGVDKFDRVFMLKLPVRSIDAMRSAGVASRAEASLADESTAPVIPLAAGFTMTADRIDAEGQLKGAGFTYGQSAPDHHLKVSFHAGMNPAAPLESADGSLGYDRYLDSMAHATGTRERVALSMAKTSPDGSRINSDIRVDRDDDNARTLVSRSGYETYAGRLRLGFSLGGMTEEGRMLGGAMKGAVAVSSTHTILARSHFSLPFRGFGEIGGFYEMARSHPAFRHHGLVSAEAITSDSYGLTWQHTPKPDTVFAVTLHRPVAITSGDLKINTVTGYTDDGAYHGETLTYSLVPTARETSLLAEYRKDIFGGGSLALGFNHQINAYNIAGLENTGGFLRGEMSF